MDTRMGRIHLCMQRDLPRFKIENTRGRNFLPNWKRRCMKLMRRKFREGRLLYDVVYGPIVWGELVAGFAHDLNVDTLSFSARQTGTKAMGEAA